MNIIDVVLGWTTMDWFLVAMILMVAIFSYATWRILRKGKGNI